VTFTAMKADNTAINEWNQALKRHLDNVISKNNVTIAQFSL